MSTGDPDADPPDITIDKSLEGSTRTASKRKDDIYQSDLPTPTPKIPATHPDKVAAAIQTIYTHPDLEKSKQYSEFDKAPYTVHISRAERDLVAGTSIRAIKIGQFLFSAKVQNIVQDGIKNIGRNRVAIEFKTATDANNFLENTAISENKLVASIPSYNVTRMGIARGVPIDINMEELATVAETPTNCGMIIKARRLHRKVIKNDAVEWVPTQSVVITFSGQVLPSRIFMYYSSIPVENYILPTIQCFQCCRFGHVRDQCRAKPRCYRCAGDHTGASCERTPTCLYCSGNHQATDKSCPEYKRQQAIKLVMSQESISYTDAAARFPAVRRPYSDLVMTDTSPSSKSRSVILNSPCNFIENSPHSYKKTVTISRNVRTKSLDRGFDKVAHSQIISEPVPTLGNGCAYPTGTTPSDDNLLSHLLDTVINIISRFADALPNSVRLQLENLAKIASHNGSAHYPVELPKS